MTFPADAGADRSAQGVTGSKGAAGADLVLEGLTKQFGSFTAVDALDLTVSSGEFFALLGPSGCGKTTTLRMVAGLEDPSSGTITLAGQNITGLRPYRRPVNTVFQNYALFPHLDTYENVAFGLRRRKERDVPQKVRDTLALVELEGFERRRPAQLSGGQQQRVALARALINRPQVLLLDEPLGALDLKLRRQMQLELKRIQTEIGITFVHVTHDQEEAMTMADNIAVMHDGLIEQMGPPEELYENPATTFVANFLGQSNLVPGRVAEAAGDYLLVDVGGERVGVQRRRARASSGDVLVGVRPEKIQMFTDEQENTDTVNRLTGGVVSDVSFTGTSTQYLVRLGSGHDLTVFAQNTGARPALALGERVTLSWAREHTFVLDGAQDIHAGDETYGERAAVGAAQ
ncbi:MAG: ABC transporter ATP-binding protein [Nocardioidaceae bacterium]